MSGAAQGCASPRRGCLGGGSCADARPEAAATALQAADGYTGAAGGGRVLQAVDGNHADRPRLRCMVAQPAGARPGALAKPPAAGASPPSLPSPARRGPQGPAGPPAGAVAGAVAGSGAASSGKCAALRAAQRALAARLANDGQEAFAEFDSLPRGGGGTSRLAQAHPARNRYCDVLPYDRTAVALPGGRYINASHVASAPGEAPAWRYIATQGPMRHTAADFWALVHSQGCGLVLMLTRRREGPGPVKCDPYFPGRPGQAAVYHYEPDPPPPAALGRRPPAPASGPPKGPPRPPEAGWRVACVAAEDVDCDVRRCELVLTPPGQGAAPRTVVHYSYHAWPDHGVPRTAAPLRRLAAAVAAAQAAPGAPGPPVVHCSAGIGRTGTFCAVDVALRRLRAAAGCGDAAGAAAAVDMRRTVGELRACRWGMVQTLEQYMLCYQAVWEQLEEDLAALEPGRGRGREG